MAFSYPSIFYIIWSWATLLNFLKRQSQYMQGLVKLVSPNSIFIILKELLILLDLKEYEQWSLKMYTFALTETVRSIKSLFISVHDSLEKK